MSLEALSNNPPASRSAHAALPVRRPTEVSSPMGGAEEKLEAIDAEVRAHEETHLAALGTAAGGGPTFDYIITPDGRRFAVGGSVHVSVSPVPGDPEATIRKAKLLIQGAYAVGMPSGADMQVAAEAYQMEVQAQRELAAAAQAAPPGSNTVHEWFA